MTEKRQPAPEYSEVEQAEQLLQEDHLFGEDTPETRFKSLQAHTSELNTRATISGQEH